VPVTLQANKSLLMKAMQQAEQSVAKARQHLCITCILQLSVNVLLFSVFIPVLWHAVRSSLVIINMNIYVA